MTLVLEHLHVELGGAVLVEDVSLRLEPSRIHAVVGESGSGKTLSALAVLDLLPAGAVVRGSARRGGVELLTLRGPARRQGQAMVLQEPLSALNPVRTVGAQLLETLAVHGGGATDQAVALLGEVGLGQGNELLGRFPHQLSGGQRQRVAIACALAAAPAVLIADEPTTALDASMRGVILSLLRKLARERGLAIWLITHDLHAVRGASDEVTVLYAGRAVEHGPTEAVLDRPRHPYTAALLASNPAAHAPGAPLPMLHGAVPLAGEVISGCRFHPRCPRTVDRCRVERPEFVDHVACHLAHPGLA